MHLFKSFRLLKMCVTFDPYNFEEAAWNAGQYMAELATNRLVSK